MRKVQRERSRRPLAAGTAGGFPLGGYRLAQLREGGRRCAWKAASGRVVPAAAPTEIPVAELKTTAAAAGAAIGGSIAHLPLHTQLLLIGASLILAGTLGALTLATSRKVR